MEQEIRNCVRSGLSGTDNIFDLLLDRFKVYYERPCTSVLEFKRRTTKGKGDMFERFCVVYLQALGFRAWVLSEVDIDLLNKLGLKRRDVGIDIIAEKHSLYYAVQAKYRVRSKKKSVTALGWAQLSTFYSVCMRTGPWCKYIVMTNCDFVRRMGRKNDRDWTIALQRLRNTSRAVWQKIIGEEGHVLGSLITEDKPITINGFKLGAQNNPDIIAPNNTEALRAKRLAYFLKKSSS